jgi:hypothetical protein
VNGIFDLGASDTFTGETELNLEFKVEGRTSATFAAGTIAFAAGSTYAGGEKISIADETYELTLDGDAGVGNVPVLISSEMTAAEIAQLVAGDMHGSNTVEVSSVTGNTISVVATTAGVDGNVAINASAGITATGLTNGSDEAVSSTVISIIAADTNAIGEAQATMTIPTASFTSGKIVTIPTVGQSGVVTQGYARKTIAYKMIDMLRKGEAAKFDIDPDRYNQHLRRGVLVSVEEWNRVRGTNSFSIELKAKQWFAWYATKGLSRPSFFENGTKVYALFESKIINGRTFQTVVAYLLADATYAELASADAT